MNLGIIIEVAIGVVFVWLVISLSTIQIQEWIASWLKFRENDLEKTIGKMLANPQLTKEFYNHPLIRSFAKKSGDRPTYIPPREFTQTLFNIFITAGTENSAIQQALASVRTDAVSKYVSGFLKKKSVQNKLDELIEQAESLAANETGSVMTQIQRLKPFQELAAIPELKAAMERVPCAVQEYLVASKAANITSDLAKLTPEQIEKGIAAIGKLNPNLERSMKSMVAGVNSYVTEAEKALAVAHTNVETWFNNSMESLSGLYKRRSQWISFGIGLFLAIALSVDSIALVQRLWIDPTVRAALVENASKFEMPQPATQNTSDPASSGEIEVSAENTATEGAAAETVKPSDAIHNFELQFAGLELPLGWTTVDTAPTAGSEEAAPKRKCALVPAWVQNAAKETTVVQGISIGNTCYRPVGTTVPLTSTQPTYDEALRTNWLFIWCIGILITALSAVQGAPFWFDTLNKLINLRGGGKRIPTSSETKPQK